MIKTTFSDIYAINDIEIAPDVHELSISHVDWADMQMCVAEPTHILLAPTGVFTTTDRGLSPITRERDLWDCVPEIDDIYDVDGHPHYTDAHAAQAVVEHPLGRIKAALPEWKFLERRDTTKKRR